MNLNELLELWIAYLSRRQWDQRKAEARAKGDSATVILAEKALARLPQISALEQLHAKYDLVNAVIIDTSPRYPGSTTIESIYLVS